MRMWSTGRRVQSEEKMLYLYPCFYGNAGGRLQSGGTERKADEVCGVPGNGHVLEGMQQMF